MKPELFAELGILRAELLADIMLATNRDQHIRSTTRLEQFDRILAKLSDNQPAAATS